MASTAIKSYLEANPRMMGVLFMMLLLLTQAGNAAAGMTTATSGP